jgi:hypothetical protein
MTNAIKVLLQMQSGFLQVESTLLNIPICFFHKYVHYAAWINIESLNMCMSQSLISGCHTKKG